MACRLIFIGGFPFFLCEDMVKFLPIDLSNLENRSFKYHLRQCRLNDWLKWRASSLLPIILNLFRFSSPVQDEHVMNIEGRQIVYILSRRVLSTIVFIWPCIGWSIRLCLLWGYHQGIFIIKNILGSLGLRNVRRGCLVVTSILHRMFYKVLLSLHKTIFEIIFPILWIAIFVRIFWVRFWLVKRFAFWL